MTATRFGPATFLTSLLLCAGALGCGGEGSSEAASDGEAVEAPAPASATAAPAPTALEAAAAVGLENAAEPLPGLLTAAQPRRIQLEELVDLGYAHVISLRPASEDGAGWEELDLRGEDVAFTRVAVAGAPGLTRENVEALDRALEAADGGPTVLYCSSSNRVGALLALRAYWLEGASPDEALALGRSAGLAGLEPAVQDLLNQPR